ncbi:MAG: TetR/AcrR family transcriptional regulator [Stackebrandtia sp.]
MNRREQAQRRREQLLDAALEVFVARGIDRATMKDVAEAAGAAPGLLYHYFDGKDALVATLLKERSFLPKLRSQLSGAVERPAVAVLPELVRNYRRVLTENQGLVSLFFSASSTNRHARTAMGEFVAEGQRLLADYLDSRVAVGELRPHDTRLFAQTLLTTVAANRHMGADTDPDQLVDLLVNGVAARASCQSDTKRKES